MLDCGLLAACARKKRFAAGAVSRSELARCMSLADLTLLGVGATLGLGVYVLAGSVARYNAGPAVMLSFLVAAIASAIAGICYAEFASRVPRAGSAYVYSYVTVGELIAFVIGWNLILEYVIGGASVARGLVGYVDAQFNDALSTRMRELMPINVSFLSPHPDFVALLIMMLLATLLSVGVRESTTANNVFTLLNVLTIVIVIVAGSFKADIANWRIPKAAIPEGVDGGEGGFLPFGVAGVMSGAAQCFYGFVGFDAVATTGEEAHNPQRNIPLAIVISLTTIFLAYFGISIVLTMVWPYYDQNAVAPLPHVFTQVGWPVVTWLVTGGAVCALCTAMLGAMFPLPRVLYAMASDGLLFAFLARVNPRTKTPAVATLTAGLVSGVLAMIFDLHQLVEMLSIGTLLAYTIVAVCVLVLRYEDPELEQTGDELVMTSSPSRHGSLADGSSVVKHALADLFNLARRRRPTWRTAAVSKMAIAAFCVLSTGLCLCFSTGLGHLESGQVWMLVLVCLLVAAMLACLMVMARQPNTSVQLTFKVPLVPALPAISIVINTYLMMMLERNTWLRFAIWMTIGFLIYFLYGVRNSTQRKGVVAKTPSTDTSSSPAEVRLTDGDVKT